ncbi:hypothetical protein T484DRAFT_1769494 [Baffinella frigidus]|nr:hypothetical protein T484DRAFT_1769494 [Cryptophyta sp. CCMP2293]
MGDGWGVGIEYYVWVAGAIPVYVGAPDAADFAPHPKAFIFASDFEDMAALGAYLNYLSNNATARAEHLQFKHPSEHMPGRPAAPFSEGFLAASNISLYAAGGEAGSAVPFPATEMRDYKDPKMEGLNDPLVE